MTGNQKLAFGLDVFAHHMTHTLTLFIYHREFSVMYLQGHCDQWSPKTCFNRSYVTLTWYYLIRYKEKACLKINTSVKESTHYNFALEIDHYRNRRGAVDQL